MLRPTHFRAADLAYALHCGKCGTYTALFHSFCVRKPIGGAFLMSNLLPFLGKARQFLAPYPFQEKQI